MQFKLDISGLSRVIHRFRSATSKTQRNLDKSLNKIGFLVQRESRKNAPYRDGTLEHSITYKTGRNYVDILVPATSAAGAYASIRHYAHYKLGVKSIAKGGNVGRLYIKRAIDDNIGAITDIVRTVFRGI